MTWPWHCNSSFREKEELLVRQLRFFKICALIASSLLGFHSAAWAIEASPDLVHIEVGGKAAQDDLDDSVNPSPSIKLDIQSKDQTFDATIFQEGNAHHGGLADLVRSKNYASGVTYTWRARTYRRIGGGVAITAGPLVQKVVIQGSLVSKNGLEVRPEIGKFASYNFDVRNRNYIGATASLTRTIDDTNKVLVALQAGAYSPGQGANHRGGSVESARLEYRRDLGENFYVGVQAVHERITKLAAFNPDFKGVSSDTKVGLFVGASFK
jgi:hypothetical protein